MSFVDECTRQRGLAAGNPLHVGLVVRFNRDERYVHVVQNEEYDTTSTGPVPLGQGGRARSAIVQLAPFQPPMEFEWGTYKKVYTEYHKPGTLVYEHQLKEATREYEKDWDSDFSRFHGDTRTYHPSLVSPTTAQYGRGGHAEEILIREWAAMVGTLVLTHVDVFLTRMPCATKSSPFLLNGVLYKQGCISKLIQLVDRNPGIQWSITYFEHLSGRELALSQALAQKGFGERPQVAYRSGIIVLRQKGG